MSTTSVGILIVVVVIFMGFGAYAIQAAEDKKKQQQLLMIRLQAAIRNANHLLSSFPPQLKTPQITAFLCNYLIQRCEQHISIEKTDTIERTLSTAKEMVASPPAQPAHPEGSITLFDRPAGANRARAVIKEFVKFLKECQAQGEINSATADHLMQEAGQCFERTEIDLELHEAQEREPINHGKSTLMAYKKCFIRLSDINKDNALDRQRFELRRRMNTLAERIEAADAEEKRLRAEEAERNELPGTRRKKTPPPA